MGGNYFYVELIDKEIELVALKSFLQKFKVNSMGIANVFELTMS